ncbi:Competence/damage-inducible protein CinA [Ignavibacterium album JCM 16511]|uniref:CinA-like protein n=1 Tax=Ignavibacterium album (strain DSM 19864 / JCM 16511 / NBRC 101810 / Mat9-16) TaxID=945713 RepID=I0AJ82_IGNAJ|nr:competence/damage-inducible protein A [Ignavibacterium album]AFH49039.1 Competence/damage-inducible protein CinA [Ignavibacterium album JCM 16511]
MKAYLISIGDELLIGQTINTNVAYIGNALSDINIEVIESSVVGDNLDSILSELSKAASIADLIVITGGLGPTHDDITRSAIVKYFNTELVRNNEVLEDINQFFAKRGRTVTELNASQALVPKIATPIRNKRGTAPGMWIEQKGKIYIVMPGVPFEMKGMMEDFVIPKLSEMTKGNGVVIKKLILQTTGIPESNLFERLGNLDELLQGAQMAFLPSQYGVKLRITVKEKDETLALNRLNEIEQKIRTKVGRYIYARGNETLEEVIGRILADRGLTIAIAESCTGGEVCSRITNVSGSSKYFERGIVTYSNASKVELLKVNEDTLAEFGAVSREVAMQMAEGVRAASGTDIGISTTGILGPTGATTNKPVGLVYIGYCDDKVCTAKKFLFGDDRILNKQRATQAALEMLRRQLLGISDEE